MVEYSNVIILTEDFYGKDFFENLVNRLEKDGLIVGNYKIECHWSQGKFNSKITRILRPKSNYLDKIIIVIDAEGENKAKVIEKLKGLIPSELRSKTEYIVFDYCIEEWICKGLGIKFFSDPVRSLNNYLRTTKGVFRGYEKYMLPKFAEEIDIDKLFADKNFVAFVKCFHQ